MDKMREEFEVWVKSDGYVTDRSNDNYISYLTDGLWKAWQASRAALCVELPKHEAAWWSEDVLDALNNAGVSHK